MYTLVVGVDVKSLKIQLIVPDDVLPSIVTYQQPHSNRPQSAGIAANSTFIRRCHTAAKYGFSGSLVGVFTRVYTMQRAFVSVLIVTKSMCGCEAVGL